MSLSKTEIGGLENWLREDASKFFLVLLHLPLIDDVGCSLLLIRVRLRQTPLQLRTGTSNNDVSDGCECE